MVVGTRLSDLGTVSRMTDLAEVNEPPPDGRVARRERNIDNVLDVVLELFGEESLFPTIEQAAKRSGLSLRSLYRYFADPSELLEATIIRSREHALDAIRLSAIGQGPLDDRIDAFVAMRMNVYEAVGAVYRATVANAARLPRINAELARTRDDLRVQFEMQFEPEIAKLGSADRVAVVAAGDLLTQLDAIDFLLRHRQLSADETRAAMRTSLRSLLQR